MNASITLEGVALEVTFEHFPEERATFIEPGYPETAEISRVEAGGVDIQILLSDTQMDSIEELCIESVRKWRRSQQENQAAEEYEEEHA